MGLIKTMRDDEGEGVYRAVPLSVAVTVAVVRGGETTRAQSGGRSRESTRCERSAARPPASV